MQSFYIAIDAGLNKLLNKRSIDKWFQTVWCSCDFTIMYALYQSTDANLKCGFSSIDISYTNNIAVKSWWARWRLKSPAPHSLTQPFVQALVKKASKTRRHWPLWGWPVDSRHKWLVTPKRFPFDDVIMVGHNVVCVIWNETRDDGHWNILNGIILFVYVILWFAMNMYIWQIIMLWRFEQSMSLKLICLW